MKTRYLRGWNILTSRTRVCTATKLKYLISSFGHFRGCEVPRTSLRHLGNSPSQLQAATQAYFWSKHQNVDLSWNFTDFEHRFPGANVDSAQLGFVQPIMCVLVACLEEARDTGTYSFWIRLGVDMIDYIKIEVVLLKLGKNIKHNTVPCNFNIQFKRCS